MDEPEASASLPTSQHEKPLRWDVSKEEILAMSEEERLQFFVDTNERIRRLYEAVMLEVRSNRTDVVITVNDINHILNPEKID